MAYSGRPKEEIKYLSVFLLIPYWHRTFCSLWKQNNSWDYTYLRKSHDLSTKLTSHGNIIMTRGVNKFKLKLHSSRIYREVRQLGTKVSK
jgi:hypothetical protein